VAGSLCSGNFGAEFHKDLNKKVTHIIQKGKNIEIDSYSGFQDNNHFMKTGLDDFLNTMIFNW
jgi:nicotinamidase/pyrazinamidase